MRAPEDPSHPPDLRLVQAALAVWAVTLLGLWLGPLAAAAVTVVGAAGAAVAWQRAWAVSYTHLTLPTTPYV